MKTFRALIVLLALCAALPARAAELIMYRTGGCPWCAAWDRDIGPIYGKTDIGRRLPIRFVDLEREQSPSIALAGPVRYSPTFILADSGKELGRIEGYPGEDSFWGLLEQLLQRHQMRQPS